MAQKPSITMPKWAIDPTAKVVEPSNEKLEMGWAYVETAKGEKPVMEWVNWLGKSTYEWIKYLSDVADLQLTSSATASVSSQITLGSVIRVTATSPISLSIPTSPLNGSCFSVLAQNAGTNAITILSPSGITFQDGTSSFVINKNKNVMFKIVGSIVFVLSESLTFLDAKISDMDSTISSNTARGLACFPKDGSETAEGNFDMGDFKITQTSAPSAPSDLTNKGYVDSQIGGITQEHNSLTNLNAGDYKHLTASQFSDLTASGDSTLHFHSVDRNRANHTGTQTASTISDFSSAVNSLDHNSKSGIQGGSASERYHLTQTQHINATSVATTLSEGLMSALDKEKLDNTQVVSQKGVADGYASLDSSAKIPESQIPSIYEKSANKGIASGYASLDSAGKIPQSQLPSIAITDTFTVSTELAMLGLTDARQGDVAIRTDLSKTFILATNSYSTLADWKEILTPTTGVTSVNGQTGVVTIDNATTSVAGLMSSTDKTKLDSLAGGVVWTKTTKTNGTITCNNKEWALITSGTGVRTVTLSNCSSESMYRITDTATASETNYIRINAPSGFTFQNSGTTFDIKIAGGSVTLEVHGTFLVIV